MIRAYYIRKLILDATAKDSSKVKANQISVKLGTVKGTMSAAINFN